MSLNGSTDNFLHSEEQQSDNATKDALDGVVFTSHERKTLKTLSPQLIASAISGLFHLVDGLSVGYLVVIVSQLIPMIGPPLYFEINISHFLWMGISYQLSVAISGFVCAFLVDKIGRLNTIKLAVVPTLVGWIFLAAAQSVAALFTGLVFLGIGVAWGTCAGNVYVTEIAHPDVRGSLLSIGPGYKMLGNVAFFLASFYIGWRVVAFIAIIVLVTASPTLILIPESPVWLISKERNVQATQSLDWFDKHQPVVRNNTTFAQLHFEFLAKEETTSPPSRGFRAKTKHFLQLFYKPFLILLGLLIFQQLSGFNVMLHFISMDYQKINGTIDWSLFIKIIHLGLQVSALVANLFLLLVFRRRTLIICGSAAMALCLLVYVFRASIDKDVYHSSWVSLAAIFLYFAFAYVSVGPVPLTMIAELFPHTIRGAASCVVYSLPNLLMLSFDLLIPRLGKLVLPGVFEWTFIVVLLTGAAYTYIFLPETHKLDLGCIQQSFESNKVYIKWFWARNRNSRRQSAEIAMNDVQYDIY